MDKETCTCFEAMNRRLTEMEGRLMSRMNDAQEVIIERVRACEASISVLTELARSGNTTISLIATLLGDVARR